MATPPAPDDQASEEYIRLVCGQDTFRPVPSRRARWLDADGDYAAARGMWAHFIDLSRDEWRGFWRQGYEYVGIFDDGDLVARAALWRYSDEAWELAAVYVLPEWRRRGLAVEVCSLVTARILGAGRLATCNTRADNVPMQKTALALGFRRPGP